MMWYSWSILVLAFLVFYIFLKKKNYNNQNGRLPPGPRPLPILGHLHLLGKSVPIDLLKLAKKHGPIMHLRFGLVPTIVVSSPEAAEQFLKVHDIVFASRPPQEAAKYLTYEQRAMAFSPYGPYWRGMRKMCTIELLSSHKIATFQSMRRQEINLLIDFIRQAAIDHVAVNLTKKVQSMSVNMSCRMVFGKKYEDKELSERGVMAAIQEAKRLVAIPNLGDFYPYIGALDLQGLTRKLKAVSKVFDGFFEKIIDEHVHSSNNRQERTKDFVDTMLAFMEAKDAEFQIDRCHVKAVMLDMLIASMDTSATGIEWVLCDLLKHPKELKKVQNELEEVVGLDRMVEESDLEKLPYLNMVVKESFRLRPLFPLLISHLSTEDCTVKGFFIPKNAHVIVNAYAIGRNPNVWPEAEKFMPERFLGENVDSIGTDFRSIPFGAGRRICPGMQLGLTVVKSVVAQLVHCFEWELPDNMLPVDLDMTEEFGLLVSRANNLLAIPTYRLKK